MLGRVGKHTALGVFRIVLGKAQVNMIRIFNHYVHRAALRGMLFDLGLMLMVALLAVTVQVGSLGLAV
jgi:hypothetical protein